MFGLKSLLFCEVCVCLFGEVLSGFCWFVSFFSEVLFVFLREELTS